LCSVTGREPPRAVACAAGAALELQPLRQGFRTFRKETMKMRISAALAIGAASVVLAFSLTLSAPVLAQSTPQPSKAAAKPLKEASDAMRARKYDAAMAKLKEVQALPNKSPYDVHLMNEMLGFLYFRANDYPSAVKA